jgi:hypothetical protein
MKGMIKTDIGFSDKDIFLIYGHFRKKINELNEFKANPHCPIHKSNLNQDVKLFSSITDKIEEVYPQIGEMNKYF